MSGSNRRGLTLIEVMAALGLAGLLLLGSRLLLDQLVDSGARIQDIRVASTRSSNALRLLEQLFANAEPAIDSGDRLVGAARSVALTTYCNTPAGWVERCRAVLAIDSTADSSVVLADLSTGEHLILRRATGHEQFRFSDPMLSDETWLSAWPSSATLPAAVALVGPTDTIIFVVGPHA